MKALCRSLVPIMLATLSSLAISPSLAQLKPDPLVATTLPAKPGAHWFWVNDIVFHHMADGKAFLFDGATGKMLGFLSTGFGFNGVVVTRDRSLVLSPEIYFSRGVRGTRTDVVTVYDGRQLAPIGEIAIPPKRAQIMPMTAAAQLTDDDRFLLVYNFTPAQSVSVVDVKTRKFVGEIDTAGCVLVYPTGPRSFFSLCPDGTALSVKLDEAGKAATKTKSAKLFEPERDPITEKGVRDGNTWLFASASGDVLPIESSGGTVRGGTRWSLTSPAERKAQWRPGGMQHLAIHNASRRLYSVMHQGGIDTYKDPGNEVWVYNLATKQRVQRLTMQSPTGSIALSADAKPLLFAMFIGANKVEVYDPASGKLLRTIAEVGFTPTNFTLH
jgi:methylamine dehydrogenase heavy chain